MNGLETGKLSVHWQRTSLEDLKPELENEYQESISVEDLPTRKSFVNEIEALISLRPSWAKKRC